MEAGKNPFGPDMQKYWDCRYVLFKKFDNGIQVDKEGLYFCKSEDISLKIGQSMRGYIILDAFCGIGGSTIGLARSGKTVIAVDNCLSRLKMAKHNSMIYCVDSHIEFVHGDALAEIRSRKYDGIYLDPPWGGPGYDSCQRFSLSAINPDGNILMREALRYTDNIAITLPSNFDLWELSQFKKDFRCVYHMNDNKILYLTVFY